MMFTYQAKKGAQLCTLITLGKFLCPLLACCITSGPLEYIFLAFLPEASSRERVQGRVTLLAEARCGSHGRMLGRFLIIFFPRMCIKVSMHLVGLAQGIAGTPLMNRMTTLKSLFFFFPLDLRPLPPFFLPPC